MLTKIKGYLFVISPIIILIGVSLRWVVYQQNRSLIIDEANLARNIVEKDIMGFFQSLDYQQYCPPIFLVLSKLTTWLFGVNEYALKLLPLIAGVAILFLFWILVKKIVKNQVVEWYLLAILSCSILAIRYSTEVKQYNVDAALTLLLIYATIQFKSKEWTFRNSLIWSLGGSLLIWTSMPSIFILAAVGFAFLYQSWTVHKKIPIGLVVSGGIWLSSFGLYFLTILYQDSTSSSLQGYHSNFFFNFLPTSWTACELDINLILGLTRSVTDKTTLGLSFGLLMILLGSYVLAKKDTFVALLLLLPVLFALIASNLKLYSLIPRLSLFIIPVLMLLLGVGLKTAWDKSTNIVKIGLAVLMFISVANKEGYYYYWTKMELENSKACLAYLADNQKENELILVQMDAIPAFVFYNDLHDDAYHLKPVHLGAWKDKAAKTIPLMKVDYPAFWLFFSHTFPQEKALHLKSANQIGLPSKKHESTMAATYLFQRK